MLSNYFYCMNISNKLFNMYYAVGLNMNVSQLLFYTQCTKILIKLLYVISQRKIPCLLYFYFCFLYL